MNGKIKIRSKLTKFYYKHGKKEDQEKLQAKAAYCTEEILKVKNDFILRMTSKLNDPKASPKTCWSILNWFLYNKKIALIPLLLVNEFISDIPLLLVNKFISDICVKANLFNDFFVSICMPINNRSALLQFTYKTNVKINSFQVNQNDISLIIKTSDTEKGHGWDNISINMIQICGDPIALPLMLVSETALKEKKVSDIWKKANVVLIHKNRRKEFIKKLLSY